MCTVRRKKRKFFVVVKKIVCIKISKKLSPKFKNEFSVKVGTKKQRNNPLKKSEL